MSRKQRRSWQEKLMNDNDLPKVVKITGKMSKKWGTGTVVIPAPREVVFLVLGHNANQGDW